MLKTYNHLSLEEPAVMQVMLDHRCSLRAIARELRRSAWTTSRELVRGGSAGTEPLAAPRPGRPRTACGYLCAMAHQHAQRLARKARIARKMLQGNTLWDGVIDALRGASRPIMPAAYCTACPMSFASGTRRSTPRCTPCPEVSCVARFWRCAARSQKPTAAQRWHPSLRPDARGHQH